MTIGGRGLANSIKFHSKINVKIIGNSMNYISNDDTTIKIAQMNKLWLSKKFCKCYILKLKANLSKSTKFECSLTSSWVREVTSSMSSSKFVKSISSGLDGDGSGVVVEDCSRCRYEGRINFDANNRRANISGLLKRRTWKIIKN